VSMPEPDVNNVGFLRIEGQLARVGHAVRGHTLASAIAGLRTSRQRSKP
jgi:hypothetical protein